MTALTYKQQQVHNRQIIENDAMISHNATPVVTFQDVADLRRAIVDLTHSIPELNHLAIVDQFNADLVTPADKMQTWRDWAWAVLEQISERQKAQDAIDAEASGLAGWALGVMSWEYSREQAQTRLTKLANGPVAKLSCQQKHQKSNLVVKCCKICSEENPSLT
jgi:hypothetical protein